MMKLILGNAGSGKTGKVTKMITRDLKEGQRVLLLLPEMATVDTERRLTEALSGVPTVSLEILNFSRLANAVFRRYGGLCYRYIGHSGKRLIMQEVLKTLAGQLQYYPIADPCDKTTVDTMLDAVEECARFGLSPSDLQKAADALAGDESNGALQQKLSDLSLLRSAFISTLRCGFDDPSDDPERMNTLLRDNAFFENTHVYLDGFYTFTKAQYDTIACMLNDGAAVTVTLAGRNPADPTDDMRTSLRTCYARLLSLCDGNAEICTMENRKRPAPERLAYVCEHLWSPATGEAIPSDDGSVRVIVRGNSLSESEEIARDICRVVRGGARYREIAVLSRGAMEYRGVIDTVLQKYEIPYYFSVKSNLSSKPLIRYMMLLLGFMNNDIRWNNVTEFLKTGFSDIDAVACGLFENYCRVWRLNGDDFLADKPWHMHPDGYVATFSDRDTETLKKVNDVRAYMRRIITSIRSGGRACRTVMDFAACLYTHLDQAQIPQRLAKRAEELLAAGMRAAAQEEKQVLQCLDASFDTIVDVLGPKETDSETFARLFDMVLSDCEIGSTPTGIDEVVVGDAAMLRPQECRFVYLFGANEGIFPPVVRDGGVFTDREKKALRSLSYEVPQDGEARLADEMYYFYSAASCACERLTVSYAAADFNGKALLPSMAVARLRALLPDLVPDSSTDGLAMLEGKKASFEYAALLRGTKLGDALRAYYRAHEAEGYGVFFSSMEEPITQRRIRLEEKTAKSLFGRDMSLTQARLETYVNCPFSYFCHYELLLKKVEQADFEMVDTGNYTHEVLERFLRGYRKGAEYTHDEICTQISELTDAYFNRMCAETPSDMKNRRLSHMIGRLKKTSALLVENLIGEFRESAFVPRDFELPITEDDKNGIPPMKIPLSDGTRVSLYGKIDRVDTFEDDGHVYVRVVDYKTGTKHFDEEDISRGLNMQMLIYLFSLWENGSERYGKDVEPAGILYLSAGTPDISGDKEPNEDAEIIASGAFKRQGIVLDDMRVLRAMEPQLEGRYIPVSVKRDDSLTAASKIASIAKFGELRALVTNQIVSICGQMKSGEADAIPIHRRVPKVKASPCSYCAYRPLCRTHQSYGEMSRG